MSEPTDYDSREGPFEARQHENARAMRIIAQWAPTLFRSNDILLVTTGTTTSFFAKEPARCEGFAVITNSATIAASSAKGVGSYAFLSAGEFRGVGMENIGLLVAEEICRFLVLQAMLIVGQ